jgi:hypothetical protein
MNADPVSGDTTVSGYTTDWTFGYNPLYTTSDVWRCMIFGTTPDDTPSGTQGHWNRKMRPMRFEIADEGSLFAIYRLISESASPAFSSAILNNPKFYPPPASGVGPPLAGHFVGSETSTFSVSVPFATPIINSATARYIRLLVDGVDVSGPVAISVAGNILQISTAYYNFAVSGLTVDPVDVTSKTIEVDIWIEVDVTVPGGATISSGYNYYPAVWAWEGVMGGRYANVTEHYHHFIRGINGIDTNALLAASREYEFTFSSAISSTETSATTITTSPWTVTRDNKKVTLTHSNINDRVIMYYGQEIAEIILIQYQTHTAFDPRLWYYRYVPASTGDYSLDDTVQPGIFTPDTLQTFNLIGYSTDDTIYSTSVGSVSGTWCPATITVGPYP